MLLWNADTIETIGILWLSENVNIVNKNIYFHWKHAYEYFFIADGSEFQLLTDWLENHFCCVVKLNLGINRDELSLV